MAPHPHIYGWDAGEEGQPPATVEPGLFPPLPHPLLVEHSATELYATPRYENGEQLDTNTSHMVHGQDVQHHIVLTELVVVGYSQSAIEYVTTSAKQHSSAIL